MSHPRSISDETRNPLQADPDFGRSRMLRRRHLRAARRALQIAAFDAEEDAELVKSVLGGEFEFNVYLCCGDEVT